jgi:hypothetical protein
MAEIHRFGSFLVARGLITDNEVISARLLQRKNNRLLGELAKDRGWLTYDDMMRILMMQEITCEKFGEIAIKKKII